MSDYGRISKAIVKAIADALRFCNGNEAQYTPGQMPNAVRLLKKRLTQKTITQNGVYIPPSNYDGFDRVTVNVEGGGGDAVLVEKSITANGDYSPSDDNADGYSFVSVAVLEPSLQSKTATANGTVTPDTGYDGLSSVAVAVPNTYSAADNGKVVSNGQLVAQTARAITQNGMVDTTENNSVSVNVPNSYGASDEGKVVSNGTLIAQTSRTVDANGTYDTTENNSVVVNVQAPAPVLQTKTATQNGTITPDSGYDGLSQVSVNVPNSYSAQDEGKVVKDGELVRQYYNLPITQNGTFNTQYYESVVVNVDASGALSNYDKWELLNTGAINDIITVYTNPQTVWYTSNSEGVLNLFRSQTVYLVKKAFSTLDNMSVNAGWLLTQAGNDPHIHEKALTEVHIDGEESQLFGSDSYPFTTGCFEGFYNLENVYLNTSAVIGQSAFANILDNQSRPSNLPLRIYMHGNTLGTCDYSAFGIDWQSTGSGGGSESESSSSGCSGESGAFNIPNLEIYVPATLLNDFKTTWASGMFANNIYPLPNE